MAQADWRRYYIVLYSEPFPLSYTRVFRDIDNARKHAEPRQAEYDNYSTDRKVLGIARVKGKSFKCQQWLYNQCLPGD